MHPFLKFTLQAVVTSTLIISILFCALALYLTRSTDITICNDDETTQNIEITLAYGNNTGKNEDIIFETTANIPVGRCVRVDVEANQTGYLKFMTNGKKSTSAYFIPSHTGFIVYVKNDIASVFLAPNSKFDALVQKIL